MALEGYEDKLPVVLVERAILQTWHLGLPYAVIPQEHLYATSTQGRVPLMPDVCGTEVYDYKLDVRYVCLLDRGHPHECPAVVGTARSGLLDRLERTPY